MFVYERITIHISGRYIGFLPAVCPVAGAEDSGEESDNTSEENVE